MSHIAAGQASTSAVAPMPEICLNISHLFKCCCIYMQAYGNAHQGYQYTVSV
jgi:hypothetical protein